MKKQGFNSPLKLGGADLFLLCRGLNFYVARFSSHGTESGGRIKRNMVKILFIGGLEAKKLSSKL